METFYFTYGYCENQPFDGGWTEITAPNLNSACALFRALHPDKNKGFMNCSTVYTEEQFKSTTMFKNGNFGRFCQERVNVTRVIN